MSISVEKGISKEIISSFEHRNDFIKLLDDHSVDALLHEVVIFLLTAFVKKYNPFL